MIGYDDFGRAASDSDAQASEVPFDEILRQLDIDPTGFGKAAEQRALRIVLIQRGPHEAKRLQDQWMNRTFSVEKLTPKEKEELTMFAAAWMDGCMVGIRVQREEEKDG